MKIITILTSGPIVIVLGLFTFLVNPIVALFIVIAGFLYLMIIFGSDARPRLGRRRAESGGAIRDGSALATDPLIQAREILDAERRSQRANNKKTRTRQQD